MTKHGRSAKQCQGTYKLNNIYLTVLGPRRMAQTIRGTTANRSQMPFSSLKGPVLLKPDGFFFVGSCKQMAKHALLRRSIDTRFIIM